MPWKELKALEADEIINVVFEEENMDTSCCKNIIEVISRSLGLISRELFNYEMEGSDSSIIIKSNKIGLLDMKKIDELYWIGYNETRNFLKKREFII